jgi:hypothetical protein
MHVFRPLLLSVICLAQPAVATDDRPAAPANPRPAQAARSETRVAPERIRLQGWTIYLNPELRQTAPQKTATMLDLLGVQLERVIEVIPPVALRQLQEVPIWINPTYAGVRPTAEYHPGAGWLRDNGRDPAMEKAIEITNVANFEFEDRRMPYLARPGTGL